MTTLFTELQISEMTKNLELGCLFIDVNCKKQVLESTIFCGVSFYEVNITDEMKEQAFEFAKTFH